MWAFLGATVDFVHALSMAIWAAGLPLLFFHRWPRLTRAMAIYAVVFVVVNQVSMWTLRECFLTTLARYCWEQAPERTTAVSREWFTVRLAYAIFGLTPSHGAVKIASRILIFATGVGVLASAWRLRRAPAKVARGPEPG